MAIPKSAIDNVRSSVDLVEVVGHVVSLKKTGNHFTGLCPFHREKTPSFKVFPESQNYRCFGCGEGGSVFDFVMETEGLSFPEAVRRLADSAGITIPERTWDRREDRVQAEVSETLELAARYYEAALRGADGEKAREYLKGRGLSGETAKTYRLGFAPGGWENLLNALSKYRDGNALELAGLASPSKRGDGFYDRFRARVIFPILSSTGSVLGFGGRSLGDDEPKYMNSPETPVYQKSRVLYGLGPARSEVRQERRILVVEGYMDVLSLHESGIQNVVATCGTAVTNEHAKILNRHAPEIVLVFDGDEAGLRAALKGLRVLLPTGATVRVCVLPEGRDPDDVVKEEGEEGFRARVDAAQDVVDFFHSQSKGEAKPAAIDRLATLVASVPSPIQRREMSGRAAGLYRFDEQTFARTVESQAQGRGAAPAKALRLERRVVKGLEADLLRAGLQDPAFWLEIQKLLERPEINAVVESRVRPQIVTLLSSIAEEGPAESPAVHVDRVTDPDVRAFLLELASEGMLDTERLEQLERDLVRRFPLLALERERERLRRSLQELKGRNDEREEELLGRLHELTQRLNELGRGEEASSTR